MVLAIGICRMDPGAEGIHLAWNSPELVSVSSPGFDIQRRQAQRGIKFQCATLLSDQLASIRKNHELATALGTFLYSQSGPLSPIDSTTAQPWPTASTPVDVFTLELARPTNHVRLGVTVPATFGLKPFAVLAIALAGGKAIAFATNAGDGIVFTLDGNGIDTVAIYTVSPGEIVVCVAPPDNADGTTWDNVPYLVRGLTLPIREADASLATAAAEWNAAAARLVAGDVFAQSDFTKLVPPLRLGVPQTPARPGERILCTRATVEDPYQEIPFGDHLSLLQIFPAVRRVLGFGYFDRQSSGLVAGETYEYRITGYCRPSDLDAGVYDFHTVESQRTLPDTFYVRDVRFTFASPVLVVLDPAPSPAGLIAVSRRGVQIAAKSVLPGWLGPSLENWDVIIDLPQPVGSMTLELDAVHKFVYAAGDPWAFSGTAAPVPQGTTVRLSFPIPVQQVRLAGSGILFAIRVPSDLQTGTVPLAVTTPSVTFAAQPLPPPPVSLTIANLQQPPGAAIFSTFHDATPQRPPAGFQLTWLPAANGQIAVWPFATGTAPPIDAMLFEIEHRDVTLPATFGPWEPIMPGANISLGTRDNTLPATPLEFAANLAEVFPTRRPRALTAGYLFHLDDVFELNDPGGPFQRPVPDFGTYHQYRIRAVDTVGRVSADWTLSNILRLEKHVPPPLPPGPQGQETLTQNPDGTTRFSTPPGVKARALVVNDPSLGPNELAILGSHRNAIVLQWGWGANERNTDKLAREFRVYSLLKTPDVIPGSITSVTASGNGWDLQFQTDRSLKDGECVGQWIRSGGYPFLIDALTGGASVVIHVQAALANPAAVPVAGPALFGRPLSSDHQRPPTWDARVAVVPITAAENYQHVFYDLLNLSADHPRDTAWVGVSAADAQDYVPDELAAAVANGGRPGNESSIVTCTVTARDYTRPVFSIPPPLGDVPEISTEEPTGRQVLVSLDLPTLIPGALPAGAPIGLDRCSIDTILGITSLNALSQVQLAMNDGTRQVVVFPNPDDEAAVVATLESANPERMATRYLMFLAAHHQKPDEIFERISGDILSFGIVQDRIPPKPARFFYRVRHADGLGRLSAGGAILPVVVRVPSIAPPAPAEKVSLSSTPDSVSIALRVAADPDIAWVLVFSTMIPVASPVTDLSGAELLRIPNRGDLYPLNGLRLRIPDSNGFLEPVAKSPADPDVTVNADGSRSLTVRIPAVFGNYVVLWTCTLSRDGIPSRVNGPFTWGVSNP